MNTPREEIEKTVKQLLKDVYTHTPVELEAKYKDFKENFFRLYTKCLETTPATVPQTLKELNTFLNIRDEVLSGKKSSLEANVQVGDYMGKKYVYPITGEPTKEQKLEYIKKAVQESAKKEKEKDTKQFKKL